MRVVQLWLGEVGACGTLACVLSEFSLGIA